MAALIENNRSSSNVSLDERELSGSERIFQGITHKPQLFAFLHNKRYTNLNNILSPVESEVNREQVTTFDI